MNETIPQEEIEQHAKKSKLNTVHDLLILLHTFKHFAKDCEHDTEGKSCEITYNTDGSFDIHYKTGWIQFTDTEKKHNHFRILITHGYNIELCRVDGYAENGKPFLEHLSLLNLLRTGVYKSKVTVENLFDNDMVVRQDSYNIKNTTRKCDKCNHTYNVMGNIISSKELNSNDRLTLSCPKCLDRMVVDIEHIFTKTKEVDEELVVKILDKLEAKDYIDKCAGCEYNDDTCEYKGTECNNTLDNNKEKHNEYKEEWRKLSEPEEVTDTFKLSLDRVRCDNCKRVTKIDPDNVPNKCPNCTSRYIKYISSDYIKPKRKIYEDATPPTKFSFKCISCSNKYTSHKVASICKTCGRQNSSLNG